MSETSASASATIRFDGGTGNDVLAFRGQAGSLVFEGGLGDDEVVISGTLLTATLNLPTLSNPMADVGDDRFEFVGSPSGTFRSVQKS